MEILYFGIGCFHFGIQETADRKFDGQRYLEEIEAALGAIASIDSIDIRSRPELLIVEWEVEEPPPPMGSGYGHFPDFTGSTASGLQVKFDVRIPTRIQSELLETEPGLLKTKTERFQVVYHYEHFGPTTYIVPIEPDGESNPSDAVILIRRFLAEEFRRVDSDFIRFETLGPTPLHTDCVVQPYTSADHDSSVYRRPWDCKEEPGTGYSTTRFLYDPEAFADAEEAFHELVPYIASELALYYSIRRTENSKVRAWSEIDQLAQTLAERQSAKGLKARFQRSFTAAKATTEGFVKLAQYESYEITFKSSVQHDYSGVYSSDKPPCFRRHLDALMADTFVAPTGPVLRILQLAEARHAKRVDTLALLVSSTLGGAIGALLTLWASN